MGNLKTKLPKTSFLNSSQITRLIIKNHNLNQKTVDVLGDKIIVFDNQFSICDGVEMRFWAHRLPMRL